MLTVHHISKSYSIEPLIQDVSFSIQRGERWGLVGPNGCGKTTLLRMIIGEEKPDSGSVQFTPSTIQIGYLPQGMAYQPEDTVGGYIARMQGDLPALSAELEALAALLADQPDQPALQLRYDRTLSALTSASESAGRVPVVFAGLGLGDLPADIPVANLSGGQKTRLGLAGVLISGPQLLLLDEPTNHLDFEMLDWLEEWMLRFEGGVLFVSHDRAFLDRTTTGILEIDPLTHGMKSYPCNYSFYLEQKAGERDKQMQQYADQQVEIAKLRSAARHLRDIARFRKGGKADSGDKFAKGFFANRGKATVGRAKHIEARLDELLHEDRLEKPGRTWQVKIDFTDSKAASRDVLIMRGLSVGYGENVLLKDIDLSLRHGDRVALVGPNGCGKTTLLRTVAGRIPPLAGEIRLGASIRVGYMAQEQEDLDPALNVLDTIRRQRIFTETEARSFLSYYLFTHDDVFKLVGNLSFGERARLTLACLVAQGCNLLLLDEPVNHLDIPARANFEQSLANFEGTVLAVVHDRYFIASFASEIWQVESQGITRRGWLEQPEEYDTIPAVWTD